MIAEIVLLLLVILFAFVALRAMKKLWPLVANSLIAMVILFGLNLVFKLGVAINIWSILIVAIGGLPGLLLVLLLNLLGMAF